MGPLSENFLLMEVRTRKFRRLFPQEVNTDTRHAKENHLCNPTLKTKPVLSAIRFSVLTSTTVRNVITTMQTHLHRNQGDSRLFLRNNRLARCRGRIPTMTASQKRSCICADS